MKTDISKFFRASLLKLNPYKSAREEYLSEGRDMILIDANENPFNPPRTDILIPYKEN